MRFEIEINGRRRTVGVTRAGACYQIQIDDRTFSVDVARVDAGTMSLIVEGEPRRSHEVSVVPMAEPGEIEVYQRTGVLRASARPARGTAGSARATGQPRAEEGGGPLRILTPMPGKVVRVLVGPGDRVAARQGLVVVEAMKMENELRAPRAGVVLEVPAAVGASIGAGQAVAVIE